MRIRLIALIGAVVLVSASVASAQQDVPAAFLSPKAGKIDFGFRATSITDDAARFQRYRDLRNGAFLDRFRFAREQATWLLEAAANNVGYRDQRYFLGFESFGKVKASFEWDQVPLFYSSDTRSPYRYAGDGVFTLDAATRQAIEALPTTTPGRASILTGYFDDLAAANRFDTRSRSDNARFNLTVTPAKDFDVKLNVRSKRRDGSMVSSVNFAFTNTIEIAAPLDDRATDVDLLAEWATTRGRVAVGYLGQWYDNNVTSLVYDNPIRFTDSPTAGPARGRFAYWPTSTAHTFSTAGSVKLAKKVRASANVSIGTWQQDADLLPATINPALPAVPLERTSAEAEARILAMNYNVNANPTRFVWLNARFRYYDYDNRTPVFGIEHMVVGDASLGAAHETEPASFQKHTFDADASFSPAPYFGLKVGYSREGADRTFRIFEKTTEDVVRVSGDLTGNQYVTVRGSYELSTRDGEGFEEHLLQEVGEHAEMRHFDIANRDRRRGTVIVTVTPVDVVGFNASVAAGHDDYKDSYFGLRDNKHRVYNAGVDIVPNDRVFASLSLGFEEYSALQWSRTANPASLSPTQFFDPTRDWSIDSSDDVYTIAAAVGLTRLIPQTELKFNYDYSRSKMTYLYGVPANSTIVAPVQLAPVRNELSSFVVDGRYSVTKNVAIGLVYLFDQYRVDDYAWAATTINSAYPLNAAGTGNASAMYLNYLYRPYTAHSAWVRMTYLW